ncbi:MAG: hypothetical protein C4323_22985 [Mastigocladus sp. ERB_26_2]
MLRLCAVFIKITVQIQILGAECTQWKIILWTVYLPMQQLTSVFQTTQPLAALYHAIVSYEIIQHLEPAHRWETENTVPYYLKTMLKQISS